MEPNPYQSPQYEGYEPPKDKPKGLISVNGVLIAFFVIIVLFFAVGLLDYAAMKIGQEIDRLVVPQK